jgi:hypothetical protein
LSGQNRRASVSLTIATRGTPSPSKSVTMGLTAEIQPLDNVGFFQNGCITEQG